jgi:hypothetical protein
MKSSFKSVSEYILKIDVNSSWFYTYQIVITTGFLDFVHRPEFYKQENTTFRKLDLFPS